MGNIVKLQNAGDSVTWRIKSAETVAGKFGAQVKFTAENGDCLFISEETAGRQLGRIPLDITQCAGETLTFSRSENPKGGAPYWNIGVADVIDRAAPAQSKRVAPPRKPLPFDEESFPPEPYAPEAQNYPVRQGNMPDLSDAPLPPEPEWVTPPARAVAPKAEARAKIAREYLDLLAWVKTQAEVKGMSDEAVQAASATIFIAWDKAGLR
jgi:hypothetical protein